MAHAFKAFLAGADTHKRMRKACVWLGLLATVWAGSAMAATPKAKPTPAAAILSTGNALLGKDKSEAERCQECHGVDGQGTSTEPGAKFARLAGQYPEYLVKQMRNFRSGERKHDVMSIMARSVEPADVIDMAAYFASQKKMHGEPGPLDAAGRALYLQGDSSRGILACAQCHGEDGQGRSVGAEKFPVLGGQDWRYLEKQLQDWRSGDRSNSPGGVMNSIAKSLTDAEIKSLANYLSRL